MSTTSATLAISASPEEIWDVVTDFETYPEWESGMLEMEGEAVVGEAVRFRADIEPERMVRMTIDELDEPNRIVLSGGLPLGLFRATRTIEIVPERRGSRVTISESVGGLMRAFVRSPPTLEPSFELYCTGLQREVKRRARG